MTFNPNIPQPGDFLSSSQPVLLQNNQSLDNVFFKNHFKFSDATNGGKHRFIELVNGTFPGGAAGEALLYAKKVGTKACLFYSDDTTTNEYQLTVPSNSNFTTCGTNTNYQLAVAGKASVTGGWTFLPGQTGLIYNYGGATTLNPGGVITVVFARPFNTIFNVVATPRTSTSIGGGNHDWDVGNLTPLSFDLTINGNYSSGDTFYFHAIGN